MSGIAGGLRVQVRTGDRERAQTMLDDYRTQDGPAQDDDEPASPKAVTDSVRLAQRALRVAVLGFVLWPLPHPYALVLAISALARKDLTGPARRQAGVAAAISLFALAVFGVVLWSLLKAKGHP
jgi:hypothetical protein